MSAFVLLFVGKPVNILIVAMVFLAGYLMLRLSHIGLGRRPNALLIAFSAWLLYAAWEWLILIKTPNANIRIDLMVIWPLLLIISLLSLYRVFR